MVDRYFRKIEDVENDIKNAMQISGILLKLKGYDKKLDDLSKISDNENNISSNLGKIIVIHQLFHLILNKQQEMLILFHLIQLK